jgi:hypothetical protein
MRFCKIHSRTYNSRLNRWFEVHRTVLESFCTMVTMVENICDLCEESQKDNPFLIEPELYLHENRMPY